MIGRTAFVVVDLGFGDAGKGRLVDALTRRHGVEVVVRYSGGAQAGHTVVCPDGRAHTFSQLGAGTFVPGVRTLLGPAMIVHPTALGVELSVLAQVGVADAAARLAIHRGVRLVTPLHQALGRLRELGRGAHPHGSCGVGIGEVVRAALDGAVLTLDAFDDPVARRRAIEALEADASDALRSLLDGPSAAHLRTEEAARELGALRDRTLIGRWVEWAHEVLRPIRRLDDEAAAAFIAGDAPLVAEGAQGVLLDEAFGFHPHTTWGRARTEDAVEWLGALAPSVEPVRMGVLRSYAVRHGAGPFPSEDATLAGLAEPHNPSGRFQGAMRRGRFDLLLARYALACTAVDQLALTHLDALPAVAPRGVVDAWRLARAEDDEALGLLRGATGDVCALAPRPLSLEAHTRRTARLFEAEARVLSLPPGADTPAGFCAFVERALGRPVVFAAAGPHATDADFSVPRA